MPTPLGVKNVEMQLYRCSAEGCSAEYVSRVRGVVYGLCDKCSREKSAEENAKRECAACGVGIAHQPSYHRYCRRCASKNYRETVAVGKKEWDARNKEIEERKAERAALDKDEGIGEYHSRRFRHH